MANMIVCGVIFAAGVGLAMMNKEEHSSERMIGSFFSSSAAVTLLTCAICGIIAG